MVEGVGAASPKAQEYGILYIGSAGGATDILRSKAVRALGFRVVGLGFWV